MNTKPMVRFDKVSKRYGPLTVLDSLELDIAPGEKVAIIGPSGSGKTTVLRMLMTLEQIDDGVIWVEGESLTHMERDGKLIRADKKHIRRVRAKIGMVATRNFRAPLFPHPSHLAVIGSALESAGRVRGFPSRNGGYLGRYGGGGS